jgi:YebC/PmpR family DNA-binding regulatory protein
MSGHSKWHNIKLKKEKTDSQRGKIFTRISKEIIIAAKEGGPDPAANFRLTAVIEKAKQVNMPNSNIQRAIEKASGGAGGEALEEAVLEGYGPHGVAILVHAATDKRTRTVPEIRNIFGKYGGALGEAGCVSWMFDKKGVIAVKADAVAEDDLMEIVLEAGAEDLTRQGDNYEIITQLSAFMPVRKSLEEKKIPMESSDITMIAKNEVKLTKNQAESVLKLMELLEENDDVQNVYANFDIPEEVMAQMGEG